MARENFGSKAAAIMAMAGSAIGLGNIWRFPFMVGQNGGAAFVIVYLFAAIFICVPIFACEAFIGKSTQLSTFGAMEKLAPHTAWKWMGFLPVVTALVIFSFYSVVGGWSMAYLLKSLTFSFSDPSISREAHGAIFGGFISSPTMPLLWMTAFMLVNLLVVTFGIKRGIEKFTKFTTPLLFVLMVVIMVYSLTLPGAGAGVQYMLKPDFSKLDGKVMLSAMGQSFFSLSLGVGTILTYSSYMKREDNLLSTGLCTAGFDLVFALISGFAIMPAVFAAGIEPGAGPGLIFETLPYIFSTMGQSSAVVSSIIAILFFLAVLAAALTSSVSMLEVGVAYLVDEKKMARGKATVLVFVGCWILGVFCSLSFGPLADFHILGKTVFDFCDSMTSDFLMTFGSLLFVIFVGWKAKREDVLKEIPKPIYLFIRWVVPVLIVAIFVSNLIMKG